MKLVKTDKVKRDVHVSLPQADGSESRESFRAVYKMPNRSEVEGLVESMRDEDDPLTVTDVLDRYLVAVEGVGDEDGNALSPEAARAGVIDNLRASQAAFDEFFKMLNPEAAKRKNSKRSRRN